MLLKLWGNAATHVTRRRFSELLACGISAQAAANLALQIEGRQVAAPVDVAQLATDLRSGGDGTENPALQSRMEALFSSATTLVLSHAARQSVEQAAPVTSSVHLDWAAVDSTSAALSGRWRLLGV